MALPNNFFAALTAPIKKISRTISTAFSNTFNPRQVGQVLTVPAYREHLDDLLTDRQTLDSRDLLQKLFRHDPDVSAAVGAYLTLADTPMSYLVRDEDGNIDEAATGEVHKIIRALTSPTDYKLGFQLKPNLRMMCQEFRYMLLLRGAIGGELVLDKALIPSYVQQVDMSTIEWFEPAPGQFKPQQKSKATGELISLDIPNFFVAYHRRDPTAVSPISDFVSAINTIAARTQVINDLYRIMRITGFPRMTIEVMEDVLLANAPQVIKDDPEELRKWMTTRLQEISTQFAALRADQPMIHYSSSKPSILNKDNPGAALRIEEVIETLNSQNQAGLKTMATIIGRAKSGTQTATVEARIAAMYADQLNRPLEQFFSRMLTFCLNLYGTPGFVDCTFAPAEMRADMELEPQRVMKASRLRADLSLGLISDVEYHLQVHGRLPPPGTPQLSGTNFDPAGGPTVDVANMSPNGDTLGRDIVPKGSKSAKSNAVKAAIAALALAMAQPDDDPELMAA